MTAPSKWTPTEMMTIVASRALKSERRLLRGHRCTVGGVQSGPPHPRAGHHPDLRKRYHCHKPNVLPLSIGDGELCETALTTVSVPEMFRYWLQGGRITVGFLGGAQIDRFANLNTTSVGGPTTNPRCACPAAAARPRSPLPATRCSSPWRRASAPSSTSSISSPRSAMATARGSREKLGVTTKGPTRVDHRPVPHGTGPPKPKS